MKHHINTCIYSMMLVGLFTIFSTADTLAQGRFFMYSDDSELFRIINPYSIRTDKYYNLIEVKNYKDETLDVELEINDKVYKKQLKFLKDHTNLYAFSSEGGTYHIRYRGTLYAQEPIPVYLESRSMKHTIDYNPYVSDVLAKNKRDEVDRLFNEKSTEQSSETQQNPSTNLSNPQPVEDPKQEKLQVTPKNILKLIDDGKIVSEDLGTYKTDDFSWIIDKIKKGQTDSERLIIAKSLYKDHTLTTEQTIEVCHIFENEFAKLDFCLFAYERVTDKQNFEEIPYLFRFGSIKQLLDSRIDTLQ